MDIQNATEEHVEAICELENQLFDNSFGPGIIRQEMRVGWGLVAVEDEKVLGYAIVRPHPLLNDLLRLGVSPDAQRKGLGRALLRKAKEMFRGPIILIVRKKNEAAFRLYRQEGFHIVGQSEDSWVMRTKDEPT
jgi:ribosomal protein S18 acetylase RimI-like enzyme